MEKLSLRMKIFRLENKIKQHALHDGFLSVNIWLPALN
jgi:hypothetical protein